MFFKRKSRNRIRSRGHVLDVKLSTQQVRALQFRWIGIGLSILSGVFLVLFVFWKGGSWMLDKFVYENEAFAIQTIDVQTDGVILSDQLRRWAMVKNGENLLALDLARVKRDLELVPLIQSATVERILPKTLRIHVVEREAVARIILMEKAGEAYAAGLYEIDESGFVMPPLDAKWRGKPSEIPPEHLPIISGVATRELRPGRQVESDQVKAALKFLAEFERSPMAGLVDFQRIDISGPETLHVYTGQGSEVLFPLAGLDAQLKRWRLIWDESQRWGKSIAMLDLSIPNNVPLRLLDGPSGAKPVIAKPIKTLRTKKKHV
jgi:hypothetical protein